MFSHIFSLLKGAANGWVDDDASSMGASIAYYAVFSIAPLLVIIIAIAGLVWGDDAVRGAVHGQLAGMLGDDGAAGVQKLLQGARSPAAGIISSVIGGVVLILGATTVFGQLQSSLDKIWRAPEAVRPSGIWALLRTRFLSFGLILALGFLLLVSLMMSAVVSALAGWISASIPGGKVLLQGINIVISIGLETALFAMIFKFMPSVRIAWRDVGMGALVTAVLLEIGKVGIGLYLGTSSTVNSYTAAGSIVVLLLWVYYAAQIFLFGAEFTWVYAREHGSHKPVASEVRTPPLPQPTLNTPHASRPVVAPLPVTPLAVPDASVAQSAKVDLSDDAGLSALPPATLGRLVRVAIAGLFLYRRTRAAYARPAVGRPAPSDVTAIEL